MRKGLAFGFLSVLAAAVSLVAYQNQSSPNVIRVPLVRVDDVRMGIGMGLTFDQAAVEKALAKTPLKLPDPLPPGDRIGFNYEDDIFVILESPANRNVVLLTVDANMNRDLRDDAKVEIPKDDKSQTGVIIKVKRTYPGNPPREAWLPYRFGYSSRTNRQGVAEDEILLTAAYRMDGSFAFQGTEYTLQLNDYNLLGQFDKSNLSRGTVLGVFPKADAGNIHPSLWGYELIPLGSEFYEVVNEALDGSWIELRRNTLAHAFIGREVPDFALTDAEGKAFRLSDYRGRLLLLDFWPSWCVPCIGQFPEVKKTVQLYEGRPFSVIGINLDSEKRLDNARKVIADNALPWRHVLEGKGYFLPIYQMLGRLPEWRMSFPLYVAIDPQGVIRCATNSFPKMQRFLEAFFCDDPMRREALFVPLVQDRLTWQSAPLPVDFSSEALSTLSKNPKVKLPPGLPKEARLGRLPNDTLLIVRESGPGKYALRFDAKCDLDLTNDGEMDLPVLTKPDAGPRDGVKVFLYQKLSGGGMRSVPFRFFALEGSRSKDAPDVFYIGFATTAAGEFALAGETFRIEIADPSADGLFSADDISRPGFLRVFKASGSDWVPVPAAPDRIALGNRLYRLEYIDDQGELVELVPIR
jgi:peroxiredoxin